MQGKQTHAYQFMVALTLMLILGAVIPAVSQSPPATPSGPVQPSPEETALANAADQIFKAKSDEEREAVVKANPKLDLSKLLLAAVHAASSPKGAVEQSLATDRWVAAVAKRTNDQIGFYEASLDSGMFLSMQGDHDEAINQYQASKEIAEKLQDTDRLGHAQMRLGIESDQISDYDAALSYYAAAYQQFSVNGNKSLLASVQTNTGLAYQNRGNLNHALECFRKALALQQERNDERGMSFALANIGHIYQEQNDFAQALYWDQRARGLFEKRQDKRSMATLLMNTGEISRLQNDYSHALEYYENALKLQRELGLKPGEAASLDSLGLLYSDQHKYPEAIDYYQKALELRQAMNRKLGIAESLHNIAKARYYLKEYEEAISLDEQASAIAKDIGALEVFSYSRTTTGMTYRSMKQFDKAKAALGEAIAAIETLRNETAGGEEEQQLFFTERLAPYQEMVGILAAQGQLGAALSQAEQVKGRVLLDVLSGKIARVTKAMTPAERQQEGELETNLATLNKALARRKSSNKHPEETANAEKAVEDARVRLTDFHTQLYAAHPELKVNRGNVEAMSEGEIGALTISRSAAMAEYVAAENEILLFVITGKQDGTGTDVREYSIPLSSDELKTMVEAFRKQLSERQLGFQSSARHLYDLLLKPAEKQLQGKTELTIVPDGGLWDLPFQALQPSDGQYALEKYAISYAPSLTVLREMSRLRQQRQEPRTSSTTLLAMGNPSFGTQTVEHVKETYRDENLAPLPEAEL